MGGSVKPTGDEGMPHEEAGTKADTHRSVRMAAKCIVTA
jgi:hypothetical protein